MQSGQRTRLKILPNSCLNRHIKAGLGGGDHLYTGGTAHTEVPAPEADFSLRVQPEDFVNETLDSPDPDRIEN